MSSRQFHPFRTSCAPPFFDIHQAIHLVPALLAKTIQRLPEDEKVAETLEDSSCLKLQKRFRGNVGRAYAAWYKRSILQVRVHG